MEIDQREHIIIQGISQPTSLAGAALGMPSNETVNDALASCVHISEHKK